MRGDRDFRPGRSTDPKQLNANKCSVTGLSLLQIVLELLHRHPAELQRVVGVVQHGLVVVYVVGAGVVERLRVVGPRWREAERLEQFVGHGACAVSLCVGLKREVRF